MAIAIVNNLTVVLTTVLLMVTMDVSYLLEGLNDKQREAVAAPYQFTCPCGAGSGKTRVLVHRIAWLMSVENASHFQLWQ